MKMSEALKIINEEFGYMVSFEKVDGCVLRSDHFPDKHAGEPLIKTEDEAWILAQKFAEKTFGKCINVCVIDHNFTPVRKFRIINR